MKHQPEYRRYLVSFDASSLGQVFTETLVIGAGIAGLRASIEAAQHGRVITLCKDSVNESNTYQAQGGIAGVFDPQDSLDAHIGDTLSTGKGLSDKKIVELVIRSGPA